MRAERTPGLMVSTVPVTHKHHNGVSTQQGVCAQHGKQWTMTIQHMHKQAAVASEAFSLTQEAGSLALRPLSVAVGAVLVTASADSRRVGTGTEAVTAFLFSPEAASQMQIVLSTQAQHCDKHHQAMHHTGRCSDVPLSSPLPAIPRVLALAITLVTMNRLHDGVTWAEQSRHAPARYSQHTGRCCSCGCWPGSAVQHIG